MRKLFRFVFLALCVALPVLLAIHWWTSPAGPTHRILPHVWVGLMFLLLARGVSRLGKPPIGFLGALGLAASLFFGGLTVGYLALMTYVDRGLGKASYAGIFSDPHKVWAPRGLVSESKEILQGGEQNSIPAVKRAFEAGATGVEIDVYFDVELGKFVVSHDRPYNLKDGKVLTLGTMLQEVGKLGYIWLDFKKMRHLDKDQLAASVTELDALCASWIPKERMYVEGEAPLALVSYARAGFPTIFDTHPLPDSNVVTPLLMNLYKAVFFLGDYTVMGMNSGGSLKSGGSEGLIYGTETQSILGDVPVFLYHVPDKPDILRGFLDMPAVRVILIQDQTLNRYELR